MMKMNIMMMILCKKIFFYMIKFNIISIIKNENICLKNFFF